MISNVTVIFSPAPALHISNEREVQTMVDTERNSPHNLSDQDGVDGIEDPGAGEELRRKIEEALDMIRPYLMADGGSVRLLRITPDHVVELELLGACGSCPMSTMTLRAGIEQALKRSVPQVSRVEAVNAPSAY